VNDRSLLAAVRSVVEKIDGVARVLDADGKRAAGLDHARSGDLVAFSTEDAWFNYYYWLDDTLAPDFARTVDIHRKPGYDPVELFMTSKIRAMARLAQKKLGLRYKMDVIPLDANLVRGSHGLRPIAQKGPLIIGPAAPADMLLFKEYIQSLLGR